MHIRIRTERIVRHARRNRGVPSVSRYWPRDPNFRSRIARQCPSRYEIADSADDARCVPTTRAQSRCPDGIDLCAPGPDDVVTPISILSGLSAATVGAWRERKFVSRGQYRDTWALLVSPCMANNRSVECVYAFRASDLRDCSDGCALWSLPSVHQ